MSDIGFWFLIVSMSGLLIWITCFIGGHKKISATIGTFTVVCFFTGLALWSLRIITAVETYHAHRLSRKTQVIQKLMRGEEVPLAEYWESFQVSEFGLAKQLKLPTETLSRLGDVRNFTIRFNTNNALETTDR